MNSKVNINFMKNNVPTPPVYKINWRSLVLKKLV